jgi:outer membrane lipoprotein-sorting protein
MKKFAAALIFAAGTAWAQAPEPAVQAAAASTEAASATVVKHKSRHKHRKGVRTAQAPSTNR